MSEIVTEGNGWFEQPGDRAELDVGFAATAKTRAAAVAALGRKVAAAAPARADAERAAAEGDETTAH